MASSLVILSPVPLEVKQVEDTFRALGRVHTQPDGWMSIEGPLGFFFFWTDDKYTRGDYCPNELAQIEAKMGPVYFAGIRYSVPALVNRAIELLPAPPGTMIDNSHGLIRPIEEIRRRIRAGEEWHFDESEWHECPQCAW